MAEEEKNDQQAPADEPAEETAAAEGAPEEAPAEEAAPEEAAAEETPAEEAAPEDAPAEAAPAAPAAEAEEEPAEQLSPRQQRRLARSSADGPGGPPRSTEERLRERAEQRARNAKQRTRWRAKQRAKRRASATTAEPPTPAAEAAEPGKRKVRQGIVVSSKADKTITVRIDRVARHRVYGKVVRATGTLHAHDERNEANEGDVVRVAESRPLSRTKRWRLVEVLEKAR